MNCQNTTEFFSDYYDGGLQAAERQALEEHLRACGTCTTEYRHFTRSLEALHETRPLETTAAFMVNLKASASQQIERRQNYTKSKSEAMTIVTPKADSRPVGKADSRPVTKTSPIVKMPATWWVPWALAATTLAAFALGFVVSGRRADPEQDQELVAALAELRELKKKPLAAAPVNEHKILEANGLVEVDGQWIPRKWRDDFGKNMVALAGQMMTREQAAKVLAKEFPPAVELPPEQKPAASQPMPTTEEILDKAGYTRVNDVAVPKAWVEKWAEGFVQIGVGEWRKATDFKEELIKEHNLVEIRGKLMTREQAEAIQAEQFVKPPANAVAANEFTRALDGLQIGPPMNFHGIMVYPLLAAAAPPEAPFTTIHAALGTDKLEISDTVGLFQVQVRNMLDADVLLLAGDVLTGGRCTRVVAEHTLVGRGQTSKVPVLCAEPGAWRSTSDRFAKESGHFVAPPSLRRSLIWEQGQGAAWSIVAKKLGGKPGGLVDLYRKQSDAIAEVRAYFSALPDREMTAVGVAVAENDALEFVELFPDHALFSAYFERLVAGAALDLLEKGEVPSRAASPFPNSMKGVKQLLESAFTSTYEAREDGFAVRRDEAAAGRVRLAEGVLQHAVLFASGAPDWERKSTYTVPKDKVKKALDEYEARIKAQGPARKSAIIHELGSINAPDITLALARHLTEADTAVRRAAVQELGQTGDPKATDTLLALLQSREGKDAAVYTETVRALARLGHDRSADVLLRQLEGGDAELARVTVQALNELLLQVKSRDVLERATGRLVTLFESSEGVSKGDTTILDPVVKSMRPAEAQAVLESVRTLLKQLVGIEFSTGTGARKFWNDREARERFLQGRTSK
ncbi:MAG: HEAT repeat domain-containing protein [Planctomycetaceae bacterium]|nr:HEAT repeat domain-containing protein [Planctomycetaceae bacterium]